MSVAGKFYDAKTAHADRTRVNQTDRNAAERIASVQNQLVRHKSICAAQINLHSLKSFSGKALIADFVSLRARFDTGIG